MCREIKVGQAILPASWLSSQLRLEGPGKRRNSDDRDLNFKSHPANTQQGELSISISFSTAALSCQELHPHIGNPLGLSVVHSNVRNASTGHTQQEHGTLLCD